MRIEGRSDDAPVPAGPYSQAVRIGNIVTVAGMVGIDPASGKIVDGGLAPQMARTKANIVAALATHGATLDDVIRVEVYLADLADFQAMNAEYATWFSAPEPTRTTVGVQLAPGLDVEVTVLAVLDRS
jgi:2-iminobutanoate/2-iminopropanoate deaminase